MLQVELSVGGVGRVVRLVASGRALEAIERLRGKHGPVLFAHSAQFSDTGVPCCLPVADHRPDPDLTRLGQVAGCTVYVDRRWLRSWHGNMLILDLDRGYSAPGCLPAADGVHFVSHFTTE
jgi:uncharacterized protein (DUF779 family)